MLTNVPWFGAYFRGEPLTAETASVNPAGAIAGSSAVVLFNGEGLTTNATPQTAVVVLPDGRTAEVSFKMPTATEGAKEVTVASTNAAAAE